MSNKFLKHELDFTEAKNNLFETKNYFSDARNNFSQDGFDFPEAENNFSETKNCFSKGKNNFSKIKVFLQAKINSLRMGLFL